MGRVTRLTILALSVATALFALAPPAAAAETLRITEPPTPMAGAVTVPFSYTFTARPGTGVPPYSFRLHPTSGALPLGLTLHENGVLNGTPTAYGTWIFRVMVIDAISASSATGQITFNVNVLPMALGPGPAAAIPALVNYQFQFATTGGMPAYTYSRTAGTLPVGVTISSTGLLVGVPHETGTFNFTVQSRDVLHSTVSRSVTLTVVAPAILGLPPSPILIGRPFSHTFTTTPGRIGSVKFERLTGFLPTGLSLSTAGLLSGTPTATGTYRSVIVATFTVGVPPVATFQDYKEITITVVPPPPVPTTKAPVPSTGTPNTPIPAGSQASSTSPGPTGSTVTTPGSDGQVPTARATSPAPGAETLAETGRMGGAAGWLCLVLTVIAAVAALLALMLRRRRAATGPGKSL